MGLEVPTYISDLNSANPLGSDDRSTADDHIRYLKAAIKATFANVAGAVTPTHTELNKLAGFTGAIPALGTATEWTAAQNFNAVVVTDGATINWDLNTQQVGQVVLAAAGRTLANPSNMKDGMTAILIVANDATGSRSITSYGSAYIWAYGVAPSYPTGAHDCCVLTFVCTTINGVQRMLGTWTNYST